MNTNKNKIKPKQDKKFTNHVTNQAFLKWRLQQQQKSIPNISWQNFPL